MPLRGRIASIPKETHWQVTIDFSTRQSQILQTFMLWFPHVLQKLNLTPLLIPYDIKKHRLIMYTVNNM